MVIIFGWSPAVIRPLMQGYFATYRIHFHKALYAVFHYVLNIFKL